jgi:hypothetical protein
MKVKALDVYLHEMAQNLENARGENSFRLEGNVLNLLISFYCAALAVLC